MDKGKIGILLNVFEFVTFMASELWQMKKDKGKTNTEVKDYERYYS